MKAPARPARRVLRSLTAPPPPRRPVARSAPEPGKPESEPDGAAALARLIAKLEAIAPSFSHMDDDAWGAWVDALPRDEFLEMIGLGNEGIGLVMRAVLYPERHSTGHTTTGKIRSRSCL